MFVLNVNELANSCNVCTIVSNLHKKLKLMVTSSLFIQTFG